MVPFTQEAAVARKSGSDTDRLIAEIIETDLANGTREEGREYQIFLLSSPDDPDTERLARPIVNDTKAESGRTWAWTMGQRYVSLIGLKRPGVSFTSHLASDSAGH